MTLEGTYSWYCTQWKTIRNLIKDKNNNIYIEFKAGVYEIPCLDCNEKYVGESSHSLNKWIYE